jgi:uncharacterized protein
MLIHHPTTKESPDMPMNLRNSFMWYELMTTDRADAVRFYRAVLGWGMQDSPGPSEIPYTVLSVGDTGLGGVMQLDTAMLAVGLRPNWGAYVGVDDVDETVRRIVAAGGTVHRAPADIPGVGRFAVVADPQGAVFQLLHGVHEGPMPDVPRGAVGNCGWHELHSDDPAAGFAFYSAVFGWRKVQAIDIGPMGVYQTFDFGAGEMWGGVMKRQPELPVSCWLYYFDVAGAEDAIARVTAAGGQRMHGPMQVPTGQWVAICQDPQGAVFGLLAPKR